MSLFVSLRLLTLIQFISAVNWLMTTIVLKFQEIVHFFIVQFLFDKRAEFQEHRNLPGGLKVYRNILLKRHAWVLIY